MNDQYTYWDHVSNAASVAAFNRDEQESTVSAESGCVIDFKTFAREYPRKMFALLSGLRVEFQELFIEYYLLEKSQSFLSRNRRQTQARVFEALRMIEQAIGALIILGIPPALHKLRAILKKAGIEDVSFPNIITKEKSWSSLSAMIVAYADCRDYSKVAAACDAPTPCIRKIFRPAITLLLGSKNLQEVAIGAYLKSLTHRSSLTGSGYSPRYLARMKRIHNLEFTAPPLDQSPLISRGPVDKLKDTPWYMFEISTKGNMADLLPILHHRMKRIFGKHPAQIFAPTNEKGDLSYGYFFARSTQPTLTRSLIRIRGIAKVAAIYNDEGQFLKAITVSNGELQNMIEEVANQKAARVHIGDFVRILSGPAKNYCGTVVARNIVVVKFPSDHQFTVTVDPSSVKILDVPEQKRTFWGEKL